MCLYPRLIRNKKYLPNKKNKGKVPWTDDKRVLWIAAPCGKCIECLKQKARAWKVRMNEEIKTNHNGKFITLTFSNEKLHEYQSKNPEYNENEIATAAMRDFLERWRKKYGKSLRHWFVTELGHQGTERIHMHGIAYTDEPKNIIEKIWKNGYIWVGEYVNEKTINYIIKYILKIDKDHPKFNPKILCSPGIGRGWENSTDAKKTAIKQEKQYRLQNGTKINLPTYYANKLWTDEEREDMWKKLLDKNERWILGQKVDTSTMEGLRNYEETRIYWASKNEQWGWGKPEENNERKKYLEIIKENIIKNLEDTK